MKRVLFITNYASPYKVEFYDELSRHLDVTVLFSDTMEEQTHRTKEWFTQGKGRFRSVQLNRRAGTLLGENFCLDVVDWLKKPFDEFVVCGYSSPTAMLAIFWLKLMRKPFYIQADGGLIRETSGPRYWLKRLLVSQASGWISSGRQTTKYLMHYGAKEKGMHLYPFTSLWEKDISAAMRCFFIKLYRLLSLSKLEAEKLGVVKVKGKLSVDTGLCNGSGNSLELCRDIRYLVLHSFILVESLALELESRKHSLLYFNSTGCYVDDLTVLVCNCDSANVSNRLIPYSKYL